MYEATKVPKVPRFKENFYMKSRYKRFDTEAVNFMGSMMQLQNGFSMFQNSVEIKVITLLFLENIIFFLFLSYVKFLQFLV